MNQVRTAPKAQENAWLWAYKIVAGLFIVILLGVHFIINHLVAPAGLLTYDEVVRYYQVPLVPVMEIIFLIFAVSHALVGLRSILLDLHPSPRLLRVTDGLMVVIGVGFTIYGAWLVLLIAGRG